MARERAYVNATIHTVDARNSIQTAILISDERIVAVGTDREILAAASAACQISDAAGVTIVPGFIDPHNHLSHSMLDGVSVDCAVGTGGSLDDVLGEISRAAGRLLPGQWLRGYGFTPWALSDGREPSLAELDEAAPSNPFFLQDVSCHRGWANSAALREAGIDEYAPQPWGGVVVKDYAGRPTGALLEGAVNPMQTRSWTDVASRDPEATLAMLTGQMRQLASLGITGLCDAAVTPDIAAFYADADRAGSLLFTVQQLHTADDFFARQDPRRPDFVKRVHERESARLRSGTMKIFADPGFPDGPLISCSHGGTHSHRGSSWYSGAEIMDMVRTADGLGIRTAIHAMGNWAVDAVLDAYEAVRRHAPSHDGLLRIEHAFVSQPQTQAPRMAELDVDLVAMPGLINETGPAFDEGWRGEFRDELAVIPIRSMIDAGVRVSFASDAPTGPVAPAELMWNAITRASIAGTPIDPEEAVTAAQALRCATINAAYAAGQAAEAGSLEVGKRANLALLDRDILSCPAEEIRGARVVETLVDGRTVFETPSAPRPMFSPVP